MRNVFRDCACVVFVIAGGGAGCSAPEPFPELHPLTGTVTRDGKPVPAGGVIFVPDPPARSGLVVDAAVQSDGTFAARTTRTTGAGSETLAGAPVGRYRVVYHPPGDGSKANQEVEPPGVVGVEAKPNTATVALPPRVGTPDEVRRGAEGESGGATRREATGR